MSAATINFHGIKSASARVMQSQGISWLQLEFRDERDELREVTLFSDDPQALLDSMCGEPKKASRPWFSEEDMEEAQQ